MPYLCLAAAWLHALAITSLDLHVIDSAAGLHVGQMARQGSMLAWKSGKTSGVCPVTLLISLYVT